MTYVVDVPRLAAKYRAGHSVAALARELGVDSSVVRARLVAADVEIRGARAASVANLLRDPSLRTRLGRPRLYSLNDGYFNDLSPEVAYVIGLMQADGSNQVERGIVCITLKASDAPLLNAVSARMAGGRPLRYDGGGNPKLGVQNRALSDGLARWGVVSPKTHTASTHPALLNDRDYWRGVIDGDGSLCVGADGRRFLTLVGSQPICSQWLAFAQTCEVGQRVNVRPHKRIFSVHLSGRQAEVMARVLYRDAVLALPRKLEVARSWGCLS